MTAPSASRPPLQNRVTPFNVLTPDRTYRGAFMGNRGVLHDDQQRIVRWRRERRWIICLLEFKDRKRELMVPGLYTELFFLDEVTALAAGHRPCRECQRLRFDEYVSAVAEPGVRLLATEIDARLDPERRVGETPRTHELPVDDLPDGAMVAIDEQSFLKWQGELRRWTPTGYTEARQLPDGSITVLTPPTTLRALRNGYVPQVHESIVPVSSPADLAEGKTMSEPIRFYDKHAPYYELTNFSHHSIVLDGKRWPTSEHYYQAMKFSDPAVQRQVRHADGPSAAWKLTVSAGHASRLGLGPTGRDEGGALREVHPARRSPRAAPVDGRRGAHRGVADRLLLRGGVRWER